MLRVRVAGMLNCSAKRVSVCSAFMTHTWKPGPFSVETITTPSTFPIQKRSGTVTVFVGRKER